MCNSRSIHCIPLQKKAFSSHRWICLELDCHWTARGCKRSRFGATVCCNRTKMNRGPIINLQREGEWCCSSHMQIFIYPIRSKFPRRRSPSLNEWGILQQIPVKEEPFLYKKKKPPKNQKTPTKQKKPQNQTENHNRIKSPFPLYAVNCEAFYKATKFSSLPITELLYGDTGLASCVKKVHWYKLVSCWEKIQHDLQGKKSIGFLYVFTSPNLFRLKDASLLTAFKTICVLSSSPQ